MIFKSLIFSNNFLQIFDIFHLSKSYLVSNQFIWYRFRLRIVKSIAPFLRKNWKCKKISFCFRLCFSKLNGNQEESVNAKIILNIRLSKTKTTVQILPGGMADGLPPALRAAIRKYLFINNNVFYGYKWGLWRRDAISCVPVTLKTT